MHRGSPDERTVPSVTAQTIELTAEQLEARRRRAARSDSPFYFWPEVPLESFHAARAEVARVTGALLAGQRSVRLERPDGGFESWGDALTVASFMSGVGPLLGWWHQRGQFETDAESGSLLALQLAYSRARAQRMEHSLQHTRSVLERAGLSLALLKGAHTAHYCFPESGVRPMTDHDVLVEAADVARAELALRDAGYAMVGRARRPYSSTWSPPGAPATVRSILVHHAENPFTVDLHDSIDVNFFGVRTLRWPSQRDWVEAPWAGSRAYVLPQPLLVAYLAAHASLTLRNLTLLRLTELVLLLQRDAEREFGWAELRELLRRADAERFVYPAFELVERFVPGTVEPELRDQLDRAATPALRTVVGKVTAATAQRPYVTFDELFMWGVSPLDHVRRAVFTLLQPHARTPHLLRRFYANRVSYCASVLARALKHAPR